MPKRKLTELDINGIFWNKSQGLSNAAIAVIYRVSRIQIWRILSKQQWATTFTNPSLRSSSYGPDLPLDPQVSRELVKLLKGKGL